MAIGLHRVEDPQAFEAAIVGPGRYTRLFICTGTAVFHFPANGGLQFDVLRFLVPDPPGGPSLVFTASEATPDGVFTSAAMGSLASIFHMSRQVNSTCGRSIRYGLLGMRTLDELRLPPN